MGGLILWVQWWFDVPVILFHWSPLIHLLHLHPSIPSLAATSLHPDLHINAWRHVYKPIPRCNMTKQKRAWDTFPLYMCSIYQIKFRCLLLSCNIYTKSTFYLKVLFSQQSWNLCRFNLFWVIIQLNSLKLRPPKKKKKKSVQKGHEISLTCEIVLLGHGPFKKQPCTPHCVFL